MRLSVGTLRAWTCRTIAGSALILSPGGALAGGFEIEQSAYFQGMSFAGVAAGGPSLAAISWNPAAASFAPAGLTTESSYMVILPKADLTVLNDPILVPPGEREVDMGRDALVGGSYTTWRLNEKTVLGLSITSPFGLSSKPDDPGWAGREVALATNLVSFNATPMVSYDIAPGVSIGAGLQLQYFDVKRLKAAAPLDPLNPLAPPFVTTKIDGDDFGVGFMAGINISPGPGTSIGLGFRSSIDHELEGNVEIGALGIKVPVEADVDLPEKVSFSVRQSVSSTVRLLGTVEWANWSRFGVIPIVLQGDFPIGPVPAGMPIANLDFKWRDGWLFALGGEYDWSPNLTLRTGVAYEISPIGDAAERLVQVPDSNHWWVSVGASYKCSENSSIDFAYSHGFFEDDAPFERTPSTVLLAGVPALVGEADVSVDLISVGWRMRWGGSSPAPEPLK